MTEEDRAELEARKRRLGIMDPDEPYPGRPEYLAGVEHIIDELRKVVQEGGTPDGHLLIVAADRLMDWKRAYSGELKEKAAGERKPKTVTNDLGTFPADPVDTSRVGRTEAGSRHLANEEYLQGVEDIMDKLSLAIHATHRGKGTTDLHLLTLAGERLGDWYKVCDGRLAAQTDPEVGPIAYKAHLSKLIGLLKTAATPEMNGTSDTHLLTSVHNALRNWENECADRLRCDDEKESDEVPATTFPSKPGGDPDDPPCNPPDHNCEACRESHPILDEIAQHAAKHQHPGISNNVLVVIDMQSHFPPACNKMLQRRIEAAADAHLGPVVQLMFEGSGASTVELGLDVQRVWKVEDSGGDELYAWLMGAHLMQRDLRIALCGVNMGACVRDTAVSLWHRLKEEQGITGAVSIVEDLCGDEVGRVRHVMSLAEAWGVTAPTRDQTGLTFVGWLQKQPYEAVFDILGREKGERFLAGDTSAAIGLAGKWVPLDGHDWPDPEPSPKVPLDHGQPEDDA